RSGLHGWLPRTADDERFTHAWPRWDRGADRRHRFLASCAELKRGPQWNRDADSRRYGHHFFDVARLSPHLATAAQEVPDLLDRPVTDRDRSLTGRQLKVGEATALDMQENAKIGSVRSDGIPVRR